MLDGFKKQKTTVSSTKRYNVSSKHVNKRTNDTLNSKESQINGIFFIITLLQ